MALERPGGEGGKGSLRGRTSTGKDERAGQCRASLDSSLVSWGAWCRAVRGAWLCRDRAVGDQVLSRHGN